MPKLVGQSSFFAPGPPARIGHTQSTVLQFLLEEVRGKVLDLGGGVGAYACVLRDRGHQVTLAEISPASIESARKNGLDVVDMNTTDWAELEGKFDTVQLVEVLEHVEDPHAFLGQVLHIALEQVLLTVPCSNDFQALFERNLTYAHIAVTDHLWHFTDKEVLALFPPGWDVEIQLVDHLGPWGWMGILGKSSRHPRLWMWVTYPLRFFLRRGYFDLRFPTRMLVKAMRQ